MVLLLAFLLLFPPLFVLGPLAGLLAASRPTTLREWAWVTAAVLWLSSSLLRPGGLATQILSAWALFLTGAFVATMLSGNREAGFRRAPRGAGEPRGDRPDGSGGWGPAGRRSSWRSSHMGWEARRELLAQVQLDPARMASARIMLDALADGVGVMAHLFPALLILVSLPGLALAWAWYHRLAVRPAGPAPEPFSEFRFSDQLIWLVVACVAVFVLPIPEPFRNLMGNVAVVAGGLYAARGAAVIWVSIESFPLLILAVIGLGVLLILPVALGGVFAIGLADTWVDFRRRFQPADTEGRSPWK